MICKMAKLLRIAAFGMAFIHLVSDTAFAESVRVRTGEHPGFTRIVIDFKQRPGWKLGRSGDQYELVLDNTDIRFDLSEAFRRIRDDRIKGLHDAQNGRLALTLACVCFLSVETLQNQGLLIDIKDGTASADNPWELSLGNLRSVRIAPRPRPSVQTALLPVILPERVQPLKLGALAGTNDGAVTPSNLRRSTEILSELAEQTTRAASQGLVSINEKALRAVSNSDERSKEVEPELMIEDLTETVGPAPNMRIETQADRDNPLRPTVFIESEPVLCVDPEAVDIAQWFSSTNMLSDLGQLRGQLVDSRDQRNPTAYSNLARRLIYLSFGTEAFSLLKYGPATIPYRELLIDMAVLMEGDLHEPDNRFAVQLHCDSAAALWGLLAAKEIPTASQINLNAIVRNTSALPLHLRQFLGPRVARKLLEFGYFEAALDIRNTISRGTDSRPITAVMLDAEIEQNLGNRRAADKKFTVVAKSRDEQAAAALIQLIESKLRDRESVDVALITQAKAMEFELADLTLARGLATVVFKAFVQDSHYASAFDHLRTMSRRGRLNQDDIARIRSDAIVKLSNDKDDTQFLALALRELESTSPTDPARIATATRFVRLGMPELAREALGHSTAVPSISERYILAEISILEGKKGIAESYLAGLDTRVARELRTQASRIQTKSELKDSKVNSANSDQSQPRSGEEFNRNLLSQSRAIRESLLALLHENDQHEYDEN